MSLGQDLRYSVRMLGRAKGFTAIAVISLALGIGANTAIFSLIDSVMLRKLPVREPDRLVELLSHYPGEPRGNNFSVSSYEHFRDGNHVFSNLIGLSNARFTVRSGENVETVNGQYVTNDFFQALGVGPAAGRLLAPGDAAVAILNWGYWKSRFNLDPAVIGREITVNGTPVTIAGVAPRGFFGLFEPYTPEVWMTLPPRFGGPLALVGRLKPGASIAQARAEMSVLFQFTINERLAVSHDPALRLMKIEIEPAAAGLSILRDRFQMPLLALMAIVGMLLLIACVNLASLLLARGAARRREMAVRVALGASRRRIARQVLTESVLLSAMGALPALYLAFFGANALVHVLTSGRRNPGLPLDFLQIGPHPDTRVLLFTAGLALLTGLLFGLAPAWSAFAQAPAKSLREMGRAGETASQRAFSKALIVTQVAFSVVLLSAAGLFIGHLASLERTDLGFRRDHLLLVNLSTAGSGYTGERLSNAYRDLLGRFEALPGVNSATVGNTPISGGGASSLATAEGFQEPPQSRRYVSLNWVAPRYFETLGIPVVEGRDFSFQDVGGPRIAIINEAMARYFFAGRDPIGKHIALDRDWKGFGQDQPYEVVGVVGDAKYYEIGETPPRTVYFNAFRERAVPPMFALRTKVDPASMGAAVRRTIGEVLHGVQVQSIGTMDQQIDASIVPERLIAWLSGIFGGLGALLAAVGLYGLLAYAAARRTHEIGVRMALGAAPGRVAWMVLGEAMRLALGGMAAGALLTIWTNRVAATLMPGVGQGSFIPIFAGAAVSAAVALAAAYLPSRRAAHVDPMEALRCE